MIRQKAGGILVDFKTGKIGLIYRDKNDDYTFAKGHIEVGETPEECAVRETEEETGRVCTIVKELPLTTYVNPAGDDCPTHMYLLRDEGATKQEFSESLKHNLVWVDYNDVYDKLTYKNLKDYWTLVKSQLQ